LVYESLDKAQKSVFRELPISTDVWNYVSNSTGGQIYDIYRGVFEQGPDIEIKKGE
jgi:hypothetical protein